MSFRLGLGLLALALALATYLAGAASSDGVSKILAEPSVVRDSVEMAAGGGELVAADVEGTYHPRRRLCAPPGACAGRCGAGRWVVLCRGGVECAGMY